MKFSIRELLWVTATIALIVAWIINSARQASYVGQLERRTREAENRSARYEKELQKKERIAVQLAERYRQKRQEQYEEILDLRQLLKESIGDQRDWFELNVSNNQLIAIGPGTTLSPDVTVDTIRYVEAATRLDGDRLLHFMTPIGELRPQAQRPVD